MVGDVNPPPPTNQSNILLKNKNKKQAITITKIISAKYKLTDNPPGTLTKYLKNKINKMEVYFKSCLYKCKYYKIK